MTRGRRAKVMLIVSEFGTKLHPKEEVVNVVAHKWMLMGWIGEE